MNLRDFSCLMLLTLCTGLVFPGTGTAQERGQLKSSTTAHTTYRFRDVGTFGGPVSYLTNDETGTGSPSGVLNSRGLLVSAADTSILNPNFPNVCILCPTADPLVVHAFLWQNDRLVDLGPLQGGNNSWANWISPNGLIGVFGDWSD